jgi:hypothetical protein
MALDFRFKPQHGPASFGIQETGASDPNLASAMHVQRGVVDESGAVMAASLGQTIGIADRGLKQHREEQKGKALSGLQSELQDHFQSYMDGQGAPQRANEALIDASQSREDENNLTAEWFTSGNGMEQIKAVRDSHANALSRLEKAQAQGSMSIQQFQERTKSITREHINRNPALMSELLEHAKQTLGITGMDDIIKAQERGEDSNRDLMKERDSQVKTRANHHGLTMQYIPNTNIVDYRAMEQLIKHADYGEQILKLAKQENNIVDEQDKVIARHFAGNEGANLREAHHRDVLKALSVINETEPNPQKRMDAMRSLMATASNDFESLPQVAKYADHPLVRHQIELNRKSNEAISKIFEGAVTQADMKTYLENQRSIMSSSENINTMARMNVSETEMILKFGTAFPHLFLNNPTRSASALGSITNLLEKRPLPGDYQATLPDGTPIISKFVGHLAKEAGNGNQAAIKPLNDSINSVYDARNTKNFESIEARYAFDDHFITMLGSSENKKGIGQLDNNAREKGLTLLHEHMELTTGNLQKDLDAARSMGGTITLATIPDGRVTILTKGNVNQQAVEHLRGRYITRVNNGILAMSNLYGSSSKEAADQLFAQYDSLKGLQTTAKEETSRSSGKIQSSDRDPNISQELTDALAKRDEDQGKSIVKESKTVNPPIEKKREVMSSLEQSHRLPNGLLEAIMKVESGGVPGQTSKAGAKGFFQWMDKTAEHYKVDVNDFHSEANGAARMLGDLQRQYKGDLPKMLAAYNWGSGNIAKQGMDNMPKETREYIDKVLSKLYA